MADKTKDGLKLNYKKTILTGFGFLATSIAWAIYDPYITKILNKILSESSMISDWSNAIAKAIPWIGEFAAAQGESTVCLGGGFTIETKYFPLWPIILNGLYVLTKVKVSPPRRL